MQHVRVHWHGAGAPYIYMASSAAGKWWVWRSCEVPASRFPLVLCVITRGCTGCTGWLDGARQTNLCGGCRGCHAEVLAAKPRRRPPCWYKYIDRAPRVSSVDLGLVTWFTDRGIGQVIPIPFASARGGPGQFFAALAGRDHGRPCVGRRAQTRRLAAGLVVACRRLRRLVLDVLN